MRYKNSDFSLVIRKVPQSSDIYFKVEKSYRHKITLTYRNKELNRQILYNHLDYLAYDFPTFKQADFILSMDNHFTNVAMTGDVNYFLTEYSSFIADICKKNDIRDVFLVFSTFYPVVKNLLHLIYTIRWA